MADEEQLLGDDDAYDNEALMNGQEDIDNGDILNGENGEPKELDSIVARVKEMEAEAQKINMLQDEVDHRMTSGTTSTSNITTATSTTASTSTVPSAEAKAEADNRSIYVGNVDYGATAEELEAHFHGCGSVNRVTILCNKYDGHPKGFAYIEFTEKESVQMAMAMDESLFRGRQIKVNPKRTNRPGLSTTNRGGPSFRGRSMRSRGYRGGSNYMYGGYRPARRGRGFRRVSFFPY
ncbi:hypothetical protein V9T40_002686 [Parthenolecanium corni]|uniref:RRM domain-containing protein n=1 Tax=Parthenolecanium corni TaxID=536013 RepID=A0AAN9TGL9_9HEMI